MLSGLDRKRQVQCLRSSSLEMDSEMCLQEGYGGGVLWEPYSAGREGSSMTQREELNCGAWTTVASTAGSLGAGMALRSCSGTSKQESWSSCPLCQLLTGCGLHPGGRCNLGLRSSLQSRAVPVAVNPRQPAFPAAGGMRPCPEGGLVITPPLHLYGRDHSPLQWSYLCLSDL